MKLGFVGGGFMGEAIVSAALRAGLVAPEDVLICEYIPGRRNYLAETYRVRVTGDLKEAGAGEGLLFLAVKPQDLASLAPLKGAIPKDRAVVSIMAGVTMASARTMLGHDRLVRVMPNTPAAIGAGMSVWVASKDVSEADRQQVRQVLGVMGHEIEVDDEKYIDMATAVSASGPGYVYLLIEALTDAAVSLGFKREVAAQLAVYTFLGSARYLEETGKHPAVARNEVTSPGGTTARGLSELESAGVRAAIARAVTAAYERAKELGADQPSPR